MQPGLPPELQSLFQNNKVKNTDSESKKPKESEKTLELKNELGEQERQIKLKRLEHQMMISKFKAQEQKIKDLLKEKHNFGVDDDGDDVEIDNYEAEISSKKRKKCMEYVIFKLYFVLHFILILILVLNSFLTSQKEAFITSKLSFTKKNLNKPEWFKIPILKDNV